MKELNIRLTVEGGSISWNYEEIKKLLFAEYESLKIRKCQTGKEAYYSGQKQKELQNLRMQLESTKEKGIHEYEQAIQNFRAQMENVISFLQQQEQKLQNTTEEYYEIGREEKRQRVIEYFYEKMHTYGEVAMQILASDWFWEEDWLNRKMSNRKLYQSLDEKITAIICDLEAIKSQAAQWQVPLMLYYAQTHSLQSVYKYRNVLEEAAQSMQAQELPVQIRNEVRMDLPEGQMEYQAAANWHQIQELEDYAKFLDIKMVRKKDRMPKGIVRHEQLDFDSFVSIDLENSGSYGLANGDRPSEMIEIGAVRYEHGKCVGTFSTLVNPGREIVPMVQKLTGITDEMVKDQPAPEEAVKQFAEFVRGAIWLGHDLKNSDIPFLERAARKSGILFETEYFDTYEYARRIQEKKGFEKMKLADLAQYYGVETGNLHRAEADADLTARLYLAMRKEQQMMSYELLPVK